jgi:hypothetical protein
VPAPKRKQQVPSWEQIASFYAGRPIKLSFVDDAAYGRTGGDGNVTLNRFAEQKLKDFLRNPRDKQTGPFNVLGLATLIHESIHNREFAKGMPGSTESFTPYLDENEVNANTGFRGAGNESQAMALGSELIPDLLQRFFGIKIGSPLSRKYEKSAKNLSSYVGAYGPDTPSRPF